MISVHPPKEILYIDEHPVCHTGLQTFFESSPSHLLVHSARSTDDRDLPLSIDLAIIEITSTQPKGIAAVRELRQKYSQASILVLSSYDECIYADRCLKAGANGFIMKSAPLSDLKRAIEIVTAGDLYVSENVKSLMINRLANISTQETSASFHNLSDRELLIVEQIGLSKNNKEIARALQISVKTIESHRSRIKAKLRLDSPQELMRYAMRMHCF
ncbi:response regulator transcription factor [Pelagicoccus sp. SDUM812002]|uniref:response regulator transcription factor n=1 Tax=Pelagicoccus sp. SDUM812002 TaxID=3041266 RepID=UPI00280E99DF|nr:response regulator transcription factor [Pelagicoccus sp. SDUM812002]MDQ8184543.1 response regulator transcription factor [Pelagicoccus sp. SDUM812002]